jgi:hypothetical protein
MPIKSGGGDVHPVGHVSVRPTNIAELPAWIASSEANPHLYTLLLQTLVLRVSKSNPFQP